MTQVATQQPLFNELVFPVTVESRFGDIIINEKDVIFMPEGIYGFEEYANYGLIPLPSQETKQFMILQCLDEPGLIFLLSPLLQNDELILAKKDLLEATKNLNLKFANCDFYAITTVKQIGEGIEFSLNLKAPLIVEKKEKKIWQYILENNNYPIDHTIKLQS